MLFLPEVYILYLACVPISTCTLSVCVWYEHEGVEVMQTQEMSHFGLHILHKNYRNGFIRDNRK